MAYTSDDLFRDYDDELDEEFWDDDDGYDRRRDDEDDEWGCVFGDDCLMPGYDHLKSECFTVEMAEAWAEEYA